MPFHLPLLQRYLGWYVATLCALGLPPILAQTTSDANPSAVQVLPTIADLQGARIEGLEKNILCTPDYGISRIPPDDLERHPGKAGLASVALSADEQTAKGPNRNVALFAAWPDARIEEDRIACAWVLNGVIT